MYNSKRKLLHILLPTVFALFILSCMSPALQAGAEEITGTLKAPPSLSADTTQNVARNPVELTFRDDAAWRAAINTVSVDGVSLDASQYDKDTAGKITIDKSVFKTSKDYDIVIEAGEYSDTNITQPIGLFYITGNGVAEEIVFTRAGLEAMTQERVLFSATNDFPEHLLVAAEGVPLKVLLDKAGIKPDARMITFRGTDGYIGEYTVDELLEQKRFRFPDKNEVEPVVALKRTERSSDFSKMDERDTPVLCFGQRAQTQQTLLGFVKVIQAITVTTNYHEIWTAPVAKIIDPATGKKQAVQGGVVKKGSKIDLDAQVKTKIYYTTDGTEPGLDSKIFNEHGCGPLAGQDEPITVEKDMTIKAKAVWFGKLDSSTATYSFKVSEDGQASTQGEYAAEPVALTVTGDGVEKTVPFTMADLEALPQKTYTYSGYNHWPSLVIFEDMTGPSLKDILDAAGLKDNATLIKVTSDGGAYSYFLKEQLLVDQRYYFPDAKDAGDVVDWPPKRSETGKKPVETIIDLDETGGKLLYGQIAPNEPTCCKNQELGGLCGGGTIEVLTTPPERWRAPHADPAPGHVESGIKVTLQHGDGTPYHAIVYYTVDGSEPTYGSNIVNISYPTFQPEMNKPVAIDGNVTIKARTIGMGKLDSEIVTFQYNTGEVTEGNGNTAGIGNMEASKNTEASESSGKTVRFADVENHWAKDAVNFLLQEGIISGETDTEFKPDEKITRARFAQFLVDALGIKSKKNGTVSFADVPAGAWYHDVVITASEEGLIMGCGENRFAPDENITREQMAVMISRILEKKEAAAIQENTVEQIIGKFVDRQDISSWARHGTALTINCGIMKGAGEGAFAPKGAITRAEAAVIILRLYNRFNT
ncbi:S-layer homology domain-containing protein [Petroclostridium sp. X23]|uniref:S-layer homology domain-containing protein n=1 Tax=Petroclostridium sp. X23 TaxID=3045146 RepID=UPI0024ACA1B2|nr:S-layer homology domain-containing protein [Petroclostridium sp. X23]WHH57766.1 S-layer homology domain-containing protein [Petroclostridium sp. X23]